MDDTRTIINLSDIEELLLKRLNEVSYISVAERAGGREEQVARLNLPELPAWATSSQNWTPQATEALERLKKELLGLADGPRSPFRVSVYAAKGGRITMRTCTVIDDQAAWERLGGIGEVATEVNAQGVLQLGASWTQFAHTVMAQTSAFGSLCLRQMEAVDTISRSQAELTAKETAASRAQVNELVREVSKAKVSAAENQVKVMAAEAMNEVAEEKKKVEAERNLASQALAKDAINKLGELGHAFVVTKMGMAPELVEVSTALQSSPAMMEALKDPRVREQLKSQENLDYLSAMLKQAADVSAQEAAEDQAPTEHPESPQSDPT